MAEVLYRKYRPQSFDDVVGQDTVVRMLRNQIIHRRISHCYMFTGIRGTGKTTVARIFARAINCEHPVNGNPCNECATCRRLRESPTTNITEYDAASEGQIGDVRDLTRVAGTKPIIGKYKVFILDEVQWMQRHAVNGILKTLEEPPEHVVFILSTTEKALLIQTLKSRCQVCSFKRLDMDTIVRGLKNITWMEQRSVEDKGLQHIALLSEGSMRDAISILDKVLSASLIENITYDSVLRIVGNIDIAGYDTMLRCIITHDVIGAVNVFSKSQAEEVIIEQFLGDFLTYLKNLIMVKNNTEDYLLPFSSDQMLMAQETAGMVSEDMLIRIMLPFQEFLSNYGTVPDSSKNTLMELLIIQTTSEDDGIEGIIHRLDALEAKMRERMN